MRVLHVGSAKVVDTENGFEFAVVNFRAGRVCENTLKTRSSKNHSPKNDI